MLYAYTHTHTHTHTHTPLLLFMVRTLTEQDTSHTPQEAVLAFRACEKEAPHGSGSAGEAAPCSWQPPVVGVGASHLRLWCCSLAPGPSPPVQKG